MFGRLLVGHLARAAPHVLHRNGRRDPGANLVPRGQLVLANRARVEAVGRPAHGGHAPGDAIGLREGGLRLVGVRARARARVGVRVRVLGC